MWHFSFSWVEDSQYREKKDKLEDCCNTAEELKNGVGVSGWNLKGEVEWEASGLDGLGKRREVEKCSNFSD